MRVALAHLQQLGWPKEWLDEIKSSGKFQGETVEIDEALLNEISRRFRGLGDIVAAVAQPIAGAIDATFGTNLQNCAGCRQRKEDLNEKFPLS